MITIVFLESSIIRKYGFTTVNWVKKLGCWGMNGTFFTDRMHFLPIFTPVTRGCDAGTEAGYKKTILFATTVILRISKNLRSSSASRLSKSALQVTATV